MTSSVRRSPVVEAVADDTWALRIPMRGPLDHVYVYILETGDGIVLVDTGPAARDAAHALVQALRTVGRSPADVVCALVTHGHPDHYGLAPWIAARTGATVLLHAGDEDLALAGLVDPPTIREREAAWQVEAGVPRAERRSLVDASVDWHDSAPRTPPSGALADGGALTLDGWRLEVVHTPGHTAGHVSFVEPRRGLVFTGDHVLPRISPNIALFAGDRRNALGDYLRSLRRLPVDRNPIGLPGHEGPVPDLTGRVEELLAHHERRLDAIEAAVGRAAATAWDVAARIGWARPWATLRDLTRSAALGEVLAHLVELEARGRVAATRRGGCATEWRLVY